MGPPKIKKRIKANDECLKTPPPQRGGKRPHLMSIKSTLSKLRTSSNAMKDFLAQSSNTFFQEQRLSKVVTASHPTEDTVGEVHTLSKPDEKSPMSAEDSNIGPTFIPRVIQAARIRADLAFFKSQNIIYDIDAVCRSMEICRKPQEQIFWLPQRKSMQQHEYVQIPSTQTEQHLYLHQT